MKKLLVLFSCFILLNVVPVNAETSNDNADRIAEIEARIKEIEEELASLKDGGEEGGDETTTSDENGNEESIIIVDDDDFYIEYTGYEVIEDRYYGTMYEFEFLIENKTEKKVQVFARSVSIDGMMVDDSIVMIFQDIAAGKKAKTLLEFQTYDKNEELPELVGDLELEIEMMDLEDYDFDVSYPVTIPLDE